MSVEVREVIGKGALARFIRLPLELPDRRPNFVPPLLADERELHDPQRNPALATCTVARWMAWRGTTAVGRVMGIVPHTWNERTGERSARFFALDSINDGEVVRSLLDQVAVWARGQGMDRLIGPFGFSDRDPQGVQIEGFTHLPVVATPTGPEWLPPLVEACGFRPFEDMVSYRMEVRPGMARRFTAVAERCLRGGKLRVVHIRTKRQLRPWVVPVLRLVNATYGELLGFTPMSEAEMQALADKYMFILDPELVVLVVDGQDAPVAFVVAAPDMSEGLQRARGHLFPIGWWYILRAMRRADQLDLLLGAVRTDLQAHGLTAVLGQRLLSVAEQRGYTHLDSHLVMVRNRKMCAQMERLGGVVWKRYRVYQRELN
ncbi:MAG: hypothetical protein JNM31_00025 [Flavobacteriales bacterium]|nr:hypothetical protein [Flavobacteriales bacterium]